jgi:hypothetical protein
MTLDALDTGFSIPYGILTGPKIQVIDQWRAAGDR